MSGLIKLVDGLEAGRAFRLILEAMLPKGKARAEGKMVHPGELCDRRFRKAMRGCVGAYP